MKAAKRCRHVRRIAVVTGTRAEYGLLRSTMEVIARRSDLELQLVVTGMHLLRKFGHTLDDIVRDGWRVDARVQMQRGNDDPLDQAEGLSRGVAGIAAFCAQAGTDIVVVLGDRIEAMAGALAGVTAGRLVAHIHGGELAPGDMDDSLRHAITKLAHLHLAATVRARRRIIRMGESPERVHVVGAPGLDRLREIVKRRGARNGRSDRALVVQHPCGRAAARERRTMQLILREVERAGLARTVVFPNSDRGHTGVVEAIEAHQRRAANGSVRVHRSVERDAYLRLLIEADVLIGNSSSGIIEAATAGTPAVNVGPRQRGREPSGASVIHAEETGVSIRRALHRALRLRPHVNQPTVYGTRPAGPRIAALLAKVPLHDRFRRKINAY